MAGEAFVYGFLLVVGGLVGISLLMLLLSRFSEFFAILGFLALFFGLIMIVGYGFASHGNAPVWPVIVLLGGGLVALFALAMGDY